MLMLYRRTLTTILIMSAIAAYGVTEQGRPTITLEKIPPYGTTEMLVGRVQGIEGNPCAVAVAICVAGGWWTKPTWDNPTVAVGADGIWTANINTGESEPRRHAHRCIPGARECPGAPGKG